MVDPIWLEQADDPAAVALREARQATSRPACWRILHRVTLVNRVLAPMSPQADLHEALRALDLTRNRELIKALELYVTGHTSNSGDFVRPAEKAVARRLPDLTGHLAEVTTYLARYFGVAATTP